jgi:hypothetical protein
MITVGIFVLLGVMTSLKYVEIFRTYDDYNKYTIRRERHLVHERMNGKTTASYLIYSRAYDPRILYSGQGWIDDGNAFGGNTAFSGFHGLDAVHFIEQYQVSEKNMDYANSIPAAIDFIRIHHGVIQIYGWAYISDVDSTDSVIDIIFVSDHSTVVFIPERQERPDVAEHFGNGSYLHAGFMLNERVDFPMLGTQNYDIYVRVTNGDMEGVAFAYHEISYFEWS